MTEQWKMTDEPQDEAQIPLGTGGDAGELPAEPKRPRLAPATLLLLGVFAAGFAAIYLVGLQNKPRAASAAESSIEQQVDSAIAELVARSGKAGRLKALFQDTDELVRMFYEYPGSAFANAELPSNPFEHLGAPAPDITQTAVTVRHSSAEDQEALRKTAEAFAELKLQSVIMSKTCSAALINGKLVTAGAKIGQFTITDIQPGRVVLAAGNSQFELKMQQPK